MNATVQRFLLACALCALAAPVEGQGWLRRRGSEEELKALQEATSFEQAGDFARSDSVLRSILETNPTSLSAIIQLERVLALQGGTDRLLPYVDHLIAADPESAIGHQMRVRAYSMLDRVEEIERAGEAWIAASPKVETPYREIARIWRQRGDLTRAAQVLERGRERIAREDALALELGDLYADAGQPERAIREWQRAIREDGQGFLLVQRRIGAMPDGGAAVVRDLVETLMKRPTTPARMKGAVQLAIDAGLRDEAARMASDVAKQLKGDERQAYLVDVARRADGANLSRVAFWAYSELLASGGAPEQQLALRTRVAELALVIGDTARATTAYAELERALAVGSPQRRQALAVRVQLAARNGDLPVALEELEALRSEFPNAPELDATISATASALLEVGRLDDAERLVATADGPRAGLVKGRILIRRGDLARARAALLSVAPGLQGGEATETIQLVTLLGKVSAQGGELITETLGLPAGERAAAIEGLLDRTATLAVAERTAILDFAAAMADRSGLGELAELVRREIITKHPAAHETPAALLALARALGRRDGGTEEALVLLEKLIIEYPRSALVPQARQELDQLMQRSART